MRTASSENEPARLCFVFVTRWVKQMRNKGVSSKLKVKLFPVVLIFAKTLILQPEKCLCQI